MIDHDPYWNVMQVVGLWLHSTFRPADQEPGGHMQTSREGSSGSMVPEVCARDSRPRSKNATKKKHDHSMVTRPMFTETV